MTEGPQNPGNDPDLDIGLDIQQDIIEGSDPSPDAATPMHERPLVPRDESARENEVGQQLSQERLAEIKARAKQTAPEWKISDEERAGKAKQQHLIDEARRKLRGQ